MSFTGCLSDDDENGGDEILFNFDNTEISGPFINDRDGDQIFIGGFSDDEGEFFHIIIEHIEAMLFGDEDFIYKYSNMTGITTLLFSDYEIRGWDLHDKHLMVYNVHPTTPGPGSATYDHELTHVDVNTGHEEHFRRHLLTGSYMLDDEFIIVGSTGSDFNDAFPERYALVYFRMPNYGDSPNEHPPIWSLAWEADNSAVNIEILERGVRIDELFSGDAIGKDLAGYINPIYDNLSLFRFNETESKYYKIIEVKPAQDFSLRKNQIAIIQNSVVYTSTSTDLNNKTLSVDLENFSILSGSDGAEQVDIYKDFLLIQKRDGLYLFHMNGKFIKIFSGSIENVWLEELDGSLLRACGTFSGSGDDSGHIDIELGSVEL